MSPLELAGAATGLLSVWLTVRASVWCWPTGLVSTSIYLVVFAEARLYGDVVTNAMFCAVGVYGWIAWTRGRVEQGGVRRATARTRLAALAACAAGVPLAGWIFARAGGALPYWDAAIMVLSFVAQLLLARKLVESWIFWIAVDVLAIGVYASRGLLATAALYAIFLGLACRGLARWRRLTPRGEGF